MKRRTLLGLALAGVAAPAILRAQAGDTAALAREAYVYLYPMVENYLSIYQYALDPANDQFKAPPNRVGNVARVFTPADTGVVTPNSDTPYSFLILDLRAEPIVVTMPPIEPERYYSLQIVDLYSHNVDYLGTRSDGNGGGDFLIAGPDWTGDVPAGIARVVRMPTSLAFTLFRTQLFSPEDIRRVTEIQTGYLAVPLSAYAGTEPPPAAPAIDWPEISRETAQSAFWDYGNFLLQFAPPLPWEAALRPDFARVGVAPAPAWPAAELAPEAEAAIIAAGDAALAEIGAGVARLTTSAGLFGTPEAMRDRLFERAMGAMGGLYGNTAVEALYPTYMVDAAGAPLDGGNAYVMRFAPGALPPVDAFWSITMYDGVTRFLVDNPLDRYLINSATLPDLVTDADGGITLHLQHVSPGAEREANWLPAPPGPFAVVMRLYLPQSAALDGSWQPPALERR